MKVHWQIPFKSLRSDAEYRINIYDADYTSNTPVTLNAGAQPFTTEESNGEDFFATIRTQSGYIRIVDNGKDANGTTLADGWWKSLVPTSDTARPVTLTKKVLTSWVVFWQGFMQAQDFTGEMYNPTQEREFPVQCALSILSAGKVPVPQVADIEPRTFAYFLMTCLDKVDEFSGGTMTNGNVLYTNGAVHIDTIYVQGGADARSWLTKMFDWATLLSIDENGEYKAAYTLLDALDDICRFWGWSCRTQDTTLYLVCPDDNTETTFLKLTRSELDTLAGGTSAGTTNDTFINTTLSGDIFASTENTDTMVRGYSKCTVKVDVNVQDFQMVFAPKAIEERMEQNGYAWINLPDDEPGIGYFTTQRLNSFDISTMWGECDAYSGFYRRQIYSNVEDNEPQICDIIAIWSQATTTPRVKLRSKHKMLFTGGSLKVDGTIWHDAHRDDNYPTTLVMRVGIGGLTESGVKWWNLELNQNTGAITHNWKTGATTNVWAVQSGTIKGAALHSSGEGDDMYIYGRIPCDTEGLYGYLWVEVAGCFDANGYFQSFEVGDLTVTYSRDTVQIPTNINNYRQREVVKERLSSREYSANVVMSKIENPLNIDCIYASDNQMKYGQGLIMNSTNGTPSSYMEKATYGSNSEYPEQHMANRVANFWNHAKRKFSLQLRTNAVAALSPRYKVWVDSSLVYPVTISNNWRDDIINVILM